MPFAWFRFNLWFGRGALTLLFALIFVFSTAQAEKEAASARAEGAAASNNILDQFGKDVSEAYNGSLLEDGVNGVGEVLTEANGALKGLAGGISSGLNDLNAFLGINGELGGKKAKVPNVPNGGILPGPGNSALGVSYVRDVFLPGITNWIVSLVLAGSVIVFIGAGLMYMVGGGDQEMQNKAREAIVWAVIGTGVTILAYAIVRVVININFLG